MTNFSNPHKLLLTFIFLFVSASLMYAQETAKKGSVGLHAGFNTGTLDAGNGLSFSFHYGFRREMILQPELAISFDSQKGKAFSSGYNYKSSALTLAAGIRINTRPQKKWNPSLFIMPGLMMGSYEKEYNNVPTTNSGSSLAVRLGISNTIHKNHMITIGVISGEDLSGYFLTYGYLF